MTARRAATRILAGIVLVLAAALPSEAREKKSKTASIPPEQVYSEALRKIEKKRYYAARTILQTLLPRIPPEDRDLLPRVQLGVADSFFLDGGLVNYGEALNAYRNFLTYFPQHEKAAYAQFMVGQSLYRQVPAPDRDQTTTLKAIEELRKVETTWPGSPWAAEAREVMEMCYNRLAEKERLVGRFYQRRKAWLAALDRYQTVIEDYPRYVGMSEVLLDLGRCLLAVNRREEAQEAFTRLAQRDGSAGLVRKADDAMRSFDRRREKEGEKIYGGLAEDDKKRGSNP